jgi:hypothetical protein
MCLEYYCYYYLLIQAGGKVDYVYEYLRKSCSAFTRRNSKHQRTNVATGRLFRSKYCWIECIEPKYPITTNWTKPKMQYLHRVSFVVSQILQNSLCRPEYVCRSHAWVYIFDVIHTNKNYVWLRRLYKQPWRRRASVTPRNFLSLFLESLFNETYQLHHDLSIHYLRRNVFYL